MKRRRSCVFVRFKCLQRNNALVRPFPPKKKIIIINVRSFRFLCMSVCVCVRVVAMFRFSISRRRRNRASTIHRSKLKTDGSRRRRHMTMPFGRFRAVRRTRSARSDKIKTNESEAGTIATYQTLPWARYTDRRILPL